MDTNRTTRENDESNGKEANALTSSSPVVAGAQPARQLLHLAAGVLAVLVFASLVRLAPGLFDASAFSAALESAFSGLWNQCLETLNAVAPPAILLGIVCAIVQMLREQGD